MDADHGSLNKRMLDSFLAHDAAGLAANYSEDAFLYGPDGQVSRGRDGCYAAFAAMFQVYEVIAFDWDDYGSQVGDYAYHWGSWTWKARERATGLELALVARTTDVRVRGADGRWLIVVDHASLPVPAAGV